MFSLLTSHSFCLFSLSLHPHSPSLSLPLYLSLSISPSLSLPLYLSISPSLCPPGVLTQGGGVFDTYVSSFYLQFSNDGRQWYTYQQLNADARPRAKVFLGNRDDRSVSYTRLDRMVSAQFVRVLPHDFQNGIYLRLELMGCENGVCWTKYLQLCVCIGLKSCYIFYI
uniref:F5/8 type C domain-containing protein n=1 Tax=Hucho hucho TaxID=62062 RepID=A0A4W5NDQ4_9TELE